MVQGVEKGQILDAGCWILDKGKQASGIGTEYLSSIEHPVSSIWSLWERLSSREPFQTVNR